jgi:large subunit ribosomal protein L10
MLRKEKEPQIEKIKAAFDNSLFAFLVDFSGSSVSEMNDFKKLVRENKSDFMVTKNTLARIALSRSESGHPLDISEQFVQSTAMIYGSEDIGACAKAIMKYHRGHKDKFRIKAIVFDKQLYGPENFKNFTELLSKDELRARLLGILKAPQSSFVRILKSVPQSFAGVLKSYIEKKSGES